MKMNQVTLFSKSCQIFVIFLTFIHHLNLLPLSDAAPVVELNQRTSSYATSQDAAIPSNELSTVVREAVSSSVETLGANATLNNSTTCQLVNNIVTKLLEAGVKTTPKCKPRTLQELKQKFLASTLNREFGSQSQSCLGLEKLTGVKDNFYYVTTSSSCPASSNIHIDPVCYGNGNHSQCSMDTELQPIIEETDELVNYFPQYVLQITCRGCSKTDDHCLDQHNSCYVSEKKSPLFYPLRRDTHDCDEDGYEKWTFSADQPKEAVVACNCRQIPQ
jgi:hypothetical protein